MDKIIYPNGRITTVAVPASSKISVFTRGTAKISQIVGYPNEPSKASLLANLSNGSYTSSAFSAAATVEIESTGPALVYYSVGTDAVPQQTIDARIQPTPAVLNATGALTAAAILNGILTSTTAAAVAGTVPTGTVMDAASSFDINDSVDWSVINTGGSNAFTVTAASGHTLVGTAAVSANTTGRFRTVKTAANTFITYRLS